LDKTKLISLIKTGGIKRVPEVGTQKDAFQKSIKFEEKLLARKKAVLGSLQIKISVYTALIKNFGANIKHDKGKIKILLEQSKGLINKLRVTTSKEKIIHHAMTIGYNKTHIEFLKREIHANMSRIESYKEMQDSVQKSSREFKTEIIKIDASIKIKKLNIP
jgi:translation initiation factor 2B subunit (eIF-2B alpha/beta/delta family)